MHIRAFGNDERSVLIALSWRAAEMQPRYLKTTEQYTKFIFFCVDLK